MKLDLWGEAKLVKVAVVKHWTGDFEVYFSTPEEDTPAPGKECLGPTCFISEPLGEAMGNAPALGKKVLKALKPFREPLQGHSVRVYEGKLALYEGDSGAMLGAWSLPE